MSVSLWSRMHSCVLLGCAALLLLLPSVQTGVHAYNVYIAAKDEQCFFEYVYRADKVVGSYWVAEGGNMDIDIKVLGPDTKTVYERERGQEGTFQFKAMKEGVHTLCFDNRMSVISG